MFLKRIYKTFADQNWPAVLIELLVVAIGIFLGLQASNWNDNRIERALERGYLIRLHEDILASAKGLERDIEFMELQLSDQEIILAALFSCQVTEENMLVDQRGIGALGLLNKPRLFRRTVDDLAATGRMSIIRSNTIREELAGLVSEVEWRDSVMESTFRIVNLDRVRIDEQVTYDVSKPIEGLEFSTAINFDIEVLCNEPQNAAAISAISFFTRDRLIAFRALRNRYKSFLPLIEDELRSRWGHNVDTD